AGRADAWTEAALAQGARSVRADAALFGRLEKRGSEVAVVPQLLEIKSSGQDITNLEPVVAPSGDLFGRLARLPVVYARTLKASLSDADVAHIEKAARPTRIPRAFELYSRGQIAPQRGAQERTEAAADLLSRALAV